MLLTEVLAWERGTQAYAQALIWEVEGYVPACRLADVYGGSVLSCAWPTLPVGENAIGEELEWLGRHRAACCEVEQALIDGGSGTYAIVRRVMPTISTGPASSPTWGPAPRRSSGSFGGTGARS